MKNPKIYEDEIYEESEISAIKQIKDELNTVKPGSEEERRLYQNLTDLLKIHDARIQSKRDHDYRMAQEAVADARIVAELDMKEIEDNRKRKGQYIDAAVNIGKAILYIGVNAIFLCAEYAWNNENTHLDQLARDGRSELKKGFNILFHK